MTGPAPAAPVPVPPQPLPLAPAAEPAPPAAETEDTDDEEVPRGDLDEGVPPEPFDLESFDEVAQPDPFAEATPERPVTAHEGASDAPRRLVAPLRPDARSSAEALAEAAAGERLELLRSVFPGRVLRLVPPAAPGGARGRVPTLDDADTDALDAPTDADGVDTDPTEPGGSP